MSVLSCYGAPFFIVGATAAGAAAVAVVATGAAASAGAGAALGKVSAINLVVVVCHLPFPGTVPAGIDAVGDSVCTPPIQAAADDTEVVGEGGGVGLIGLGASV